jgi:hypothetical protein
MTSSLRHHAVAAEPECRALAGTPMLPPPPHILLSIDRRRITPPRHRWRHVGVTSVIAAATADLAPLAIAAATAAVTAATLAAALPSPSIT